LIYLEVKLFGEQSKLSSRFKAKAKAQFAHHVRNFMTSTVATMLLRWSRL